ncbi:MAG: hypothetical protein COU35_03340 [Candidatus Magasanikbacteria bacterium CG10_big_fil_rev_8_21_14_0_10_47_10]|uniref:Glycerophosphoryl diester phosphodiesterase membrane domain-containing protein n=1 Tax=Candidatus Magasanikbacteria bacterium CG10_big_fil_rev_8_21_14_0_10_47_10 TaxID=1974652 RepID=A0A2H0TQ70_9BACT|nr:MAG: hypothetical protein COU35_03340 [Candidatus Magasanikbacteria bacterium CG10_big_fil_rev_8_21_14_0_10_47_10]
MPKQPAQTSNKNAEPDPLVSARELIKKSVTLYKNNWKLFLRYMGLLAVPVSLASVTGTLGVDFAISSMNAVAIGVIVLLLVFIYWFSLWVSNSFVRTIRDIYTGKKPRAISQEMEISIHLLWPSIVILLLSSITILSGFVLLIVPGIIFSVWYAFPFYEVILDGERGWKAMRVSRELVRNHWWGSLWRIMAPGVVFGALFFILELIAQFAGGLVQAQIAPASAATVDIVVLVIIVLLGMLLTPLTTAAPTILFLELQKLRGMTPLKDANLEKVRKKVLKKKTDTYVAGP